MKTSTVILSSAFTVCLIATLCLLYGLKQTCQELDASKVQSEILDKGLKVSNAQIGGLQSEIAIFRDSVMRLNTQKGWLEIQLNQKEISLSATATKYMQAKEKHDTVAQVIYCDTLVMDGEKYLSSNQLFRSTVDSLIWYRDRIDIKRDTITKIDSSTIKHLTTALVLCEQQKVNEEKKIRRAQKGGLIMGALGWLIGAVVYVLK